MHLLKYQVDQVDADGVLRFFRLKLEFLFFESLLKRLLGQFFYKLNTNSKIPFLQSLQFLGSKYKQPLRNLQFDSHILVDVVQLIHKNGFDMFVRVGFEDNILDIFYVEGILFAVFLDGVDGVADAEENYVD